MGAALIQIALDGDFLAGLITDAGLIVTLIVISKDTLPCPAVRGLAGQPPDGIAEHRVNQIRIGVAVIPRVNRSESAVISGQGIIAGYTGREPDGKNCRSEAHTGDDIAGLEPVSTCFAH